MALVVSQSSVKRLPYIRAGVPMELAWIFKRPLLWNPDVFAKARVVVPVMENNDVGLVVPIPTLPSFVTTKFVALEEPMTNEGPEPMLLGFTDRSAQGVDVPNPRREFVVSTEKRFPMFHAFTADARVVEAD